MSVDNSMDALLDVFMFETQQNLEQLEKIILDYEQSDSEQSGEFSIEAINEIFRIMHTIKGSAAMMMFGDIASVAHKVEDLFYFIREHQDDQIDCTCVPDLILESLDLVTDKLEKIKLGDTDDMDVSELETKIINLLNEFKGENQGAVQDKDAINEELNVEKNDALNEDDSCSVNDNKDTDDLNCYKAHVFFEEGCEMESIRAFDLVNKLSNIATNIKCIPDDIMDSDNSIVLIRENGFELLFDTDKDYDEIEEFISKSLFVSRVMLKEVRTDDASPAKEEKTSDSKDVSVAKKSEAKSTPVTQSQPAATIINVQVQKLDKLMDLVGEMVISEAMVVQNPDLNGLELENFKKASHLLHKITTELQDTVMSIRMVPLADVFQKMYRIVRDMGKKLEKEVKLEIIGEETEVDKNIIAHLSDPLMHLVRNSIDHGIEDQSVRAANNKPSVGTVTLEAKNAGNDVLVIVRDDGGGLNKDKILQKAKRNGLLTKDESEMTEKEIMNHVFLPGFSTNEDVTEYSGRGVGMDVVVKNIEEIGGSVSVSSTEGKGTAFTIKIPLTLAIIDGMNTKVGDSCYTIPITSIKESFRLQNEDVIEDLDGNEMILVRGQCYSIIRLHECFNVSTGVTEFTDGVFIMVEQDGETVCLFADELLGQQQVVVKALPKYINDNYSIDGLAGCTLLGDGSISLILNVGWFVGLK